MKVVRQWMIKPFENGLLNWRSSLFVAALLALSSCNPTEITGKNVRSNIIPNDGSFDGKAYVYRDNPTMYSGPSYGPANPDMRKFIDVSRPELITENTLLNGNCSINFFFYGSYSSNISSCIRSLSTQDNLQSLPRNENRTYIFTPGSAEFYQTNALYHIQSAVNTFFKKLEFAYNRIHALSYSLPKSLPPYLKDSKMYWFKGVTTAESRLFRNEYLNSFAQCNQNGNASFSPAGPELCFGHYSTYPGFYFIQDPSVIYHETAHALVSIMMNLRNGTATDAHKFRSSLGSFGYDEAGSINEAITDYYSFIMNKRTHFGEWALGRTAKQSRPISEADSLHIHGVSKTSEGRLSYPQYVLYDPNNPNSPFEDVHYAGQIVSHYLVALTESFISKCGLSSESDKGHDTATSYVLMLLAETMSELGDLNAKGIDDFGVPFSSSIYFSNLDPNNSYLWAQHINQPTFRRFFQVFAKNIYKYISPISGGLCPSFTKTDSEKLLDDYGLLLFKNYNDNGNSTKNRSLTYNNAVWYIPNQNLTQVSESNRRKSVLISKQLLTLATKSDTTPNAVSFYIIDNRSDMDNLLKELLFKGLPVPLSSDVAHIDYNNGNIKISPGEIVALIPNLFNSSNSTMAGVQLLASDWDHVHITDQTTGNFKPCVIDTTTTVDQGGQGTTSATTLDNGVTRTNTCNPTNGYPDKDYNRLVKDPGTQLFPANAAAPVCLVQLEENNSTRWVSQNEFRKKQGLSLLDKDCLGYSTSGTSDTDFTFNPHECLVRFLPGASDAFFSKIDPQKNYYESVVKNSETLQFNTGNLLIMEVNRWIPPGTKFRCRLRARFSNCRDCFNDPVTDSDGNTATENDADEYLDSDYNGHKPFQIINFDFDVND